MKKTFDLKSSDLPVQRQLDAIKGKVNKYLKRERRKKLTDGVDFWDFDCRIGLSVDTCKTIHPAELSKAIDAFVKENEDLASFYLEVLAKPGVRTKKPSKSKAKSTSGSGSDSDSDSDSDRATGSEWMADE